ncbi:MAG: Type 1 glutamine amidotransferase-like domain-containing protein [Clostridiales bacterium]|nr:Type 1 glutamine amidotransferase-like domain-containing protein [Clostridiales bacterium]
MKKLILSSSGFDNRKIGDKFIELIGMKPNMIKVLFIPTAAVTESQKNIIPLCKNELIDIGIEECHITSYDFEEPMTIDEMMKFDAVYVCGGSTTFLLEKMNNGYLPLANYLNHGGVYLGVSAGSIALTTTHENGLGYIDCHLKVHQQKGSPNGSIDLNQVNTIVLTDDQAIVIVNKSVQIFQ